MGEELRNPMTLARTTRAAGAQPTKPMIAAVAAIEAIGETFSGRRARKVRSTNSHGSDNMRSMADDNVESNHPPASPDNSPTSVAMDIARSAVPNASENDARH